MPPPQAQALRELVRRGYQLRIEQPDDEPNVLSFPLWLRATSPEWNWDWRHLKRIQDALEAQARGEIEHLMVLCPPQHGKSECVTVRYPVWRLEQNPQLRVIMAAYNQSYADKLARKARRIARERLQLSEDRKAVSEWETAQGGSYKAVGIGSGVTGNPADLAVLDDPIKSREEAESEVYRDKIWDWYTDELSTRMQPNSRKCLVLTPWHEDDLRGRILTSAEAARWTVLKLPAFAEENDPLGRSIGEPLCPERFDTEELLSRRATMGGYSFEALYQCNPSAREGSFFKVTKLEFVDAVPAGLPTVRAWDKAATEEGGDYTAGVKMAGPDKTGLFYVCDVARGQWSTETRNAHIRMTAELDGVQVKIRGAQDPGSAGVDDAKAFIRLLAGFSVTTDRESGPKEVRADPYSAQVNAGNVRLVRGPWNRAYIEELRQFPTGKHDDQIDSSSNAFNRLTARRLVEVS